MSRKEYIGLPGTFREKMKGMKQPGLDFSRLVRDEMRANGYPTKECTDVCNQPDICDLLTDCGFSTGSGTTTVALGLAGQNLTVTVNGVGDTIALPSGGSTITLDAATNPALTLLAGVLKLDLTVAGSYSNTTSGLTSTSIQGVIDEIDVIIDGILSDVTALQSDVASILAYTYTNGLTKTGSDIELGGTLEHNTVIDTTTPFTFEVLKDNVKLLVSPGGFGAFGTGESVRFSGTGPNTVVSSGVYTNAIGNASWGTHFIDTSTNLFMRGNFNMPLQAIRFDTGINLAPTYNEAFVGIDSVRIGSLDSTTSTSISFAVENHTLPTVGISHFIRNIKSFPDNATASASLPVDALYKDPNGFVKIVY